jgi:hypothetical protein
MGFKEDCIWMSYRYCIGRRSIAACCHAGEIIKHGLDWIPEDRREFTASDIRREINDSFAGGNVTVTSYGPAKFDVLTLIMQWYEKNPLSEDLYPMRGLVTKHFNDHHFYVDCNEGKVSVEPISETAKKMLYLSEYGTIFSKYSDYLGWIKLANILDKKRYLITTNFDGKEEEFECISYAQARFDGSVVQTVYATVDKVKENPFIDSYICEEYITRIVEIVK